MTAGSAATEREDLARALTEAAVLRGHFVLRSGAVSDYYIDKYRLTTKPALLARLTAALVPLLPEDAQRIAGPALGAVPLATALSLASGLPALFVRVDSPKDHGTGKVIEGLLDAGDRVVIVEDIVTSGGASAAAVAALRAAGAEVIGVVAVVDREQGGPQALAAIDVPFRALFTRTELGLGG